MVERAERIAAPPPEPRVGGRAHAGGAAIDHVPVDHRRHHVFVAEPFLNRADVAAIVEQVRGGGRAEGLARCTLGDPRFENDAGDGEPQDGLVEVVTTLLTGLALGVEARGAGNTHCQSHSR